MAEPSTGEERPTELVFWWTPRGKERVFDLSAWPEERVEAVRGLLDEVELEHRWEDASLVVDAADREAASALIEQVVEDAQPRIDADAPRAAYDMTGWPEFELGILEDALDELGVLYEWVTVAPGAGDLDGEGDDEDAGESDAGDGGDGAVAAGERLELQVAEADEDRVDELFERLDLGGPNPGIELDGEALTTLLTTLFVSVDRLAGDADDADAIIEGHRAMVAVEELAVPYGMDRDGWRALVDDAARLRALIEAETSGERAGAAARDVGAAGDGADVLEADELDEVAADEGLDAGAELDDEAGLDDGSGLDEEAELDDEALAALRGDDAIMAVAARLRDRLKRIL